METFYALRQMYPDIEKYFVSSQIRLSEDGSIEVWDCPYERPTQEELETAWTEWESGALGRAKKEAVTEINRLAGEARSRIGTDIPFQDAVYLMKGDEAFAYPSDPNPTADNYQMAFNEAQGRNKPVIDIIAEYCYNRVMWPIILGAIEGVRTGANDSIRAATTVEEIDAILDTIVWPVLD